MGLDMVGMEFSTKFIASVLDESAEKGQSVAGKRYFRDRLSQPFFDKLCFAIYHSKGMSALFSRTSAFPSVSPAIYVESRLSFFHEKPG
jgi:hypothetical protein